METTNMELNDILATVRANATAQIETCRLIETRMVDMYVLAAADGAVLHSDGVHGFGVKLGNVERSRDRAKVEALLAHVIEHNPGNSVVAGLKIMGWKKAARLQREIAQNILDFAFAPATK
jgi:hypothetical protein